jgi:hypothetical protein
VWQWRGGSPALDARGRVAGGGASLRRGAAAVVRKRRARAPGVCRCLQA